MLSSPVMRIFLSVFLVWILCAIPSAMADGPAPQNNLNQISPQFLDTLLQQCAVAEQQTVLAVRDEVGLASDCPSIKCPIELLQLLLAFIYKSSKIK
jgi:hypothetical protein